MIQSEPIRSIPGTFIQMIRKETGRLFGVEFEPEKSKLGAVNGYLTTTRREPVGEWSSYPGKQSHQMEKYCRDVI